MCREVPTAVGISNYACVCTYIHNCMYVYVYVVYVYALARTSVCKCIPTQTQQLPCSNRRSCSGLIIKDSLFMCK